MLAARVYTNRKGVSWWDWRQNGPRNHGGYSGLEKFQRFALKKYNGVSSVLSSFPPRE
jgi:hypothetical protein